MSRARNLADVISGSYDVPAAALDNAPDPDLTPYALQSTVDAISVTPAEISDQANTSTGYIDLPTGTNAQRPDSPTGGEIRYNSEFSRAEIYDATGWNTLANPPTLLGVSPTSYNGASGQSFTVTGSGFLSGATVKFVTSGGQEYGLTTTYVSDSELTAVTTRAFTVAEEPLDVKVVNPDTLASNVLFNEIDCGGIPTWSTSSGQLISQTQNKSYSTTVSATDPDGQSLIYTLSSGSLPNGTLNQSTGVISGTTPSVSGDTNYPFEVTATDPSGNVSASRAFSILVKQFNDPVLIYNYNQDTGNPADSFSGWSWYHQAASSNGTVYQANDYIQLECNGLGSTYAGITTAMYTSSPISIPSDHNRLEVMFYVLDRQSNGNDAGGDIYMKLSTSPSSQTYGGNGTLIRNLGSDVGNGDGYMQTSVADVSGFAGSSNYHLLVAASGGQNCNIDLRFYRFRTYRA